VLPITTMRTRSVKSRMRKGLRSTKKRAQHFLETAPIFKVNIDIDTLTNSSAGIAAQQEICDRELGQNQPAQCFSARWVDQNGNNLAFYLAKRWIDEPVSSKVILVVMSVFNIRST
jgi:hypothetical protein